MADLDRLEVQVEASAAKANAELDKMLGKLDKIINSLSAFKMGKSVNIDTELRNVADSMEKVKQSAKSIESPKMDISQIEQTVSSLKEQFKNIGKDFKFTGDAAQAEKEIAYLQSKFEKLREREDKAITLGKVDTVSFKSLQYDIALTTNKLSVLQERLKELSNIEQPKFDFDMAELNRKAEELREKFKDVGKNFEFTGNADQFYEALDAARGKLDELEQRHFQLIISGKVDEDLQKEIVKTENMLDSLEQKQDEFASIPRMGVIGGYEDLSASVNEFMKSMEEAGDIDKDFRERFESSLRNLKIPEINETSLDKLKSSLEKREADLERFRTKLENDITMGRVVKDIDDSGYRKAREQIALTEKEIDALRGKIQEAESQAGRTGGFQILQKMMSGLISVGNVAGNVLSGLGSAGNVLRNSFSGLVSRIKKVTSGMTKLASKVNSLRDLMLRLGRANKKSDASFAKGLKTILKYTLGIRSLYVLVNRIRRAIIGGYENLAQYSNQVNSSISGMSSALLRLKNAFAVAFAPIVSTVAPYITAFINMMGDAFNAIGRFFTALTGRTIATQATKVYKDYAKGLAGVSDAAEDARKSLSVLGFDQLNQLQDNSTSDSNNGSGEISPADMFTEVPIESAISEWARKIRAAFLAEKWEELGAVIADGINVGLQKIYDAINWNNVGPKITYFVDAFARTFNSLVDHINWELMGRVIGAGINTIVNTFNLLAEKIDFENIGKKISVGFRGMLDEVEWTNLGNAIGNKFMIAWRMFDGLVTDMWRKDDAGLTGWTQLGISMGNALNGIIQKVDFGKIGASLGKAITGIFQTAIDLAGKFDWWVLGFKIGNGINEFLRNFDAQTVATGASEVIKGILDSLIEAVQTVDWELLGKKIAEFIANMDWAGIAGRLFELVGSFFDGFLKAFKELPLPVQIAISALGAFFIVLQTLSFIGTIAKALLTFISLFGTLALPIGIAAAAIGGLIAVGVLLIANWDKIKKKAGELKDWVVNKWDDIKKGTAEKWNAIKSFLSNTFDRIKTDASSKFNNIKSTVSGAWENTKSNTSTTWGNIKTNLSTGWNTLKTNASTAFAGIRSTISSAWEATKSTTSSVWSSIKSNTSNTWNNLKTSASNTFNNIKEAISRAWRGVNTDSDATWGQVEKTIKAPINNIIKMVNNMISGVATQMNKFIKMLNKIKIPSWVPGIGGKGISISTISNIPQIPTFAQGGYPETGQLFLARENGINEMIGRIGNRSAVANNDQIVEAVSSGVAGAMADVMMAFMGQGSDSAAPILEFTLKTDNETLYRAVLKGKEKHDRRWNVAAEF